MNDADGYGYDIANDLGKRLDAALKDRDALAIQYMALSDAMGYDSGVEGMVSPEEFATGMKARLDALAQPVQPATHTLDEDFEHFKSYTCGTMSAEDRLRMAYEHGDDRGRRVATIEQPVQPVQPAPSHSMHKYAQVAEMAITTLRVCIKHLPSEKYARVVQAIRDLEVFTKTPLKATAQPVQPAPDHWCMTPPKDNDPDYHDEAFCTGDKSQVDDLVSEGWTAVAYIAQPVQPDPSKYGSQEMQALILGRRP